MFNKISKSFFSHNYSVIDGSDILLHTKAKTIFVILGLSVAMHQRGKTANRRRHNLHTKYLPITKACSEKILNNGNNKGIFSYDEAVVLNFF
jgi:hypothetical protein